jgi:hypothetical protein
MLDSERNRITVIQRAANILKAPFREVEEAFEYQFKFLKKHIESRGTESVLLPRLGRFKLTGRYKGQQSFDEIDQTKGKTDAI